MLHVYPPFYKDFHCTASACPDNCCVGWEVVVDDAAAGFYNRLPAPLGGRAAAIHDHRRRRGPDHRHDRRPLPLLDRGPPVCRLGWSWDRRLPAPPAGSFPGSPRTTASSRNTASAWPAPRPPAGFSPSPGHGSWKRKASRGTPPGGGIRLGVPPGAGLRPKNAPGASVAAGPDSPGGTGPLPGYGQPVPGRLPWADAGAPGRRPKFCPNSGPVLRETFVPSSGFTEAWKF